MKHQYTLNPKYENFKDSLINIKNIFSNSSQSIHKARNELKVIEINGLNCVVKSFKVPHTFNKIAYTFFRDGKAKKSYNNAVILNSLDINTPEPIGIIEFYANGLLSESYFVSIHEIYDFTIREVFHHKVDNYIEILKQFTQFTYQLHQKNVWHVDYSPGNILITKEGNTYKFSLVDINRMVFKSIPANEGLKNFNKFWASKEDLKIMAQEYARLSKINPEDAYQIIIESSEKIQNIKNIKLWFKKYKKILNYLLPSSKLNIDATFNYNTFSTIKPIQINELSLIAPIKKSILTKRYNSKSIDIQRFYKKMALIVPYRKREEHLKEFLPYIENYLKNQNIDFEIIIVEQKDEKPFNRAKLMNVGAINASKDVDYFVFHDVDLLPKNIDYRFCNHSLKLFTFIKQENGKYKEYKQTNFGGAVLIPKNIFFDVNGFSNNYWQWGSEDDDFFMRHIFKGLTPLYDTEGKFTTLPHEHSLKRDTKGNYTSSKKVINENKKLRENNKKTFSTFKRALSRLEDDGASTIRYKIISLNTNRNVKTISVSL